MESELAKAKDAAAQKEGKLRFELDRLRRQVVQQKRDIVSLRAQLEASEKARLDEIRSGGVKRHDNYDSQDTTDQADPDDHGHHSSSVRAGDVETRMVAHDADGRGSPNGTTTPF